MNGVTVEHDASAQEMLGGQNGALRKFRPHVGPHFLGEHLIAVPNPRCAC